MMALHIQLVAALSALFALSFGQPEGWRMIDRFYGFRFEIIGDVIDKQFEQYAIEQADELGCFGWIQKTRRNTLVGEARCSKIQGNAQSLEF